MSRRQPTPAARRPGYINAEQFEFKFAGTAPEPCLHSLLTPADLDEIDGVRDGILAAFDPFNGDPPSKRKGTETARVLAILDSLERGNR